MSTTSTPNLGLVKPTPGTDEPADIAVINGNMDLIDQAIDDNSTDLTSVNAAITATNARIDDVEDDIEELQAYNEGGIFFHLPIYKDSYTAVVSDAVLNEDPDFRFDAVAGRRYYGTLNLALYDPDAGGADFKCGWKFPTGRMSMFVRGPDTTFGHTDVVDLMLSKVYRDFPSHASQAHIGVNSLGIWTQIDFVYECENAGEVIFEWCQNTVQSEEIRIVSDSHMIYRSHVIV